MADHPVAPLGLLHMRCLQRWFTSLCLDPKRHKHCMVNVPPSVQEDLHYWGSPQHLSTGTLLGKETSYIAAFTDASLMGWGSTCLPLEVLLPQVLEGGGGIASVCWRGMCFLEEVRGSALCMCACVCVCLFLSCTNCAVLFFLFYKHIKTCINKSFF